MRYVTLVVSAALLVGLVACSPGRVSRELGVRDDATSSEIDVIIDALARDSRVESARYITPEELAERGEVDTTYADDSVTISEDFPNGYVSIELKPGMDMSDLDAVERSIQRLPEYEAVILE